MHRYSWKIWFLLILSSFLIVYAGHSLGGRQGVLWTFVFSSLMVSLFYFYGDIRISQIFQTRSLEGQDPWGILDTTQTLAQKARIPMPEVYEVKLPSPTAFSLGRNWSHSKIYLSDSLIHELQPEDLVAVLAHEVAKIKLKSTLPLSMASALTGGIFIIPSLYKNIGKKSAEPRGFTKYLRKLWAPVMSFLLSLISSPRTTYEIDELAAQLLEDPKALAKTLWKLEAYCNTRPLYLPLPLSHLFIINPLTGRDWFKHFLNQPQVEKRILKLIGTYPL